MAKTRVRCPSCNVILKLNKTGENQSITCAKCHFSGAITLFAEVEMKKIPCPSCKVILSTDPEEKDPLVCPKCGYREEKTVIPDRLPSGKSLSRPGVLVWTGGDVPAEPRTIILKKGVNILGRGTRSSIQIDTADEFISRVHARIELVVKGDDTFEHLLSDAESRNGTYHNGERIGEGEVVILGLNDLVRIGHTTYTFSLE